MAEPNHPFAKFSRKYAPVFAVLCTVILVLMWNNSGPSSVLISGHQFVEGQTEVQAGPLRVSVNGRVSIRVTPKVGPLSDETVAGLSRYSLPEQLTDASVSVTVHRGSASVYDHSGLAVGLGPGEAKTFSPPP